MAQDRSRFIRKTLAHETLLPLLNTTAPYEDSRCPQYVFDKLGVSARVELAGTTKRFSHSGSRESRGDVEQLIPHRVFAQPELSRDVSVREPCSNYPRNIGFPL